MQLSTTARAQATEISQKDTYRLIIFDPAGTGVLLESQGNEYRLPKIEIPRFTRPAKEVTELIRNSWNLSSLFLFSGVLEEAANTSYVAVLESKDGFRLRAPGTDWFTIHHALSNLLFSEQERRAVESSYRKAVSQILVNPLEPFCRVGWVRELEDWTRGVLGARGIELKGFEQLNGCETFSLIRFDTTHGPVWFKAVGQPNLHEYGISQALAKLLPSYLPNTLATKPEWHGWLMSDGIGITLDEPEDLSAWQTAVASLAGLQIEYIGTTDTLLEAGCRDLRITRLFELVDPFLEVMTDLMQQQTKVPPPMLTHNELFNLGACLKDALHCVAALQIPDALGHSDVNPGNIIVAPERCTFIDWAEAHVGHPLLTFEALISHLRRSYPALIQFEDAIRSSYSQPWQEVLRPEHFAEALLFSPLVAVFAYAVAGKTWRDVERLQVPGFPGFLRSLTRRMHQEAESIQRRRVECLN
jgi:hypothetical protein